MAFEIRQSVEDQTEHYVFGTKLCKVFFIGKAEECLNWVKARRKDFLRKRKNAHRRDRHQAMLDLGLQRVRGALGGVYYE